MPAAAEAYASPVHDIYDGISPAKYKGTNTGRVVFITGASKGLGLASAKAYAASGASLFISARSVGALETITKELEAEFKVPVAFSAIDVFKPESVKLAVEKAIEKFGKIDIAISNAGGGEHDGTVGDSPLEDWWSTIELNLKGTYIVLHYTLPEIRKTKGYFILMSSALAQYRLPGNSAYNIGKLSLTRLAEWIDAENKQYGVKAIAMHPGGVLTDLSRGMIAAKPGLAALFNDKPELEAWTQVRLTSGSEDWLSGRFYDATWGFDQITAQKDRILEDDALKIRLALPHSK